MELVELLIQIVGDLYPTKSPLLTKLLFQQLNKMPGASLKQKVLFVKENVYNISCTYIEI